jgi:hypothetical protein
MGVRGNRNDFPVRSDPAWCWGERRNPSNLAKNVFVDAITSTNSLPTTPAARHAAQHGGEQSRRRYRLQAPARQLRPRTQSGSERRRDNAARSRSLWQSSISPANTSRNARRLARRSPVVATRPCPLPLLPVAPRRRTDTHRAASASVACTDAMATGPPNVVGPGPTPANARAARHPALCSNC